MPSNKPKVLLIGWDAADWKVITPLLEQGLMPTLNAFIDEGVMGNLATLQPMFSPMLWNSIATGMRPDKHGIYGFLEPDPQTGGTRPVASTSRKVKAIWNILTLQGLKAHVLGWFAGHPAEPVNGTSMSDSPPPRRVPPAISSKPATTAIWCFSFPGGVKPGKCDEISLKRYAVNIYGVRQQLNRENS